MLWRRDRILTRCNGGNLTQRSPTAFSFDEHGLRFLWNGFISREDRECVGGEDGEKGD